jgi:hypothetical protein
MSYDISFRVQVGNTEQFIDIGMCDANITWNVREMICKSTGLEWNNEANNGPCNEIMPKIQYGLNQLTNHPNKYKQYESENGWGTIEGCKRFFKTILDDWHECEEKYGPEVCRWITFWIT